MSRIYANHVPSAGSGGVNRLASTIMAFGLLLSFSLLTIGAGHGMLPAGLMLFTGLSTAPLAPPVVLGWIGVIAAVASCFIANCAAYLAVFGIAVAALCACVAVYVQYSETVEGSLVTAIPFAIMVVGSVLRLLLAARGS
jgi:hypothetical protein